MSRKASWLIVLVLALVPLLLLTVPTNASTTYSIPFKETFETSQTASWTVGGLWHWVNESAKKSSCEGVPGIELPDTMTGNGMWFGDDSSCTYDYTGTPHSGSLLSPVIKVQAGASAVDLSFDYFRQVEYYATGGYDKTYVEYSTDSGNTWHQIWYRDSSDDSPDGPSPYDWVTVGPLSIPAPSAYSGSGPWYLQVRFVFDTVDAFANNFLGWEIDNIEIISAAPEGLIITDTNIPECIAGDSYTYTFHVQGGVKPYIWEMVDLGDLAGTDFEIGRISGTLTGTCPSTAGLYKFEIQAKDSRGETSPPKQFTLVVEAPSGGADKIFFDDLENLVQSGSSQIWEHSAPGWSWTGTGLWHLVNNTNCTAPDPGYASPTHAFYYGQDSSCNYNTGWTTKGELTSSAIDVSTYEYITLGFKWWREVESFKGPFDQTGVRVRWSSDGTTWGYPILVWYMDSSMVNGSRPTSQGPFNGWWLDEIPLSKKGNYLQIQFVFNSNDAFANNYAGWLIDDVKLLGAVSVPTCSCELNPATLPDGTVGTAYGTHTLTAENCTGGTPTGDWTWSHTGTVPPGLTLDETSTTNTTTISGTPTTADTYTFTVTATNPGSGCTAERQYTVTISGGGAQWCETFEGAGGYNHAGWTAGGLWHVVSKPWKTEHCPAYTGGGTDNDAWYGQDATCNYNTGTANSGSLVSPNIPVTAGIWNLTFDSYLSAEVLAAYDLANVYVSFDGGAWGAPIWTKAAATYNVWQNVGPVSINVPTGASNMQLKFEFNTVDYLYNNSLGWEVDNICVQPGAGGTGLSAPVPLVVSQVLNFPNPVESIDTTTFLVEGQGIAGLEVEIFNLAGTKVFDSGFTKGNQLAWHLQNDEGLIVANGVYLYVVTVKGWDGTELKSEIHKLVVLK